MDSQTERKARTRERVLQEAAAAIRANGPARIGVAAVMARAGLTHGGFYAHFGSKDDLVYEAIGFMFQDRYATFFESLYVIEPIGALRHFIEYYLSMEHRDLLSKGCPVPILAAEVHRLPDPAKTRFAEAVDRLVGGIATLLARCGVPDAEQQAQAAVAEMVGAIVLARTFVDADKAESLLANVKRSMLARFNL